MRTQGPVGNSSIRSPVALINMPWASIRSGSIALGILKRLLRRKRISCDIYHFNLSLAKRMNLYDYEAIALLLLTGDWLFSQYLFGEYGSGELKNNYSQIDEKAKRSVDSLPINYLEIIRDIIPPFLEECLNSVLWDQYVLVGFTSLFTQHASSLLLARKIKERFPHIKIVFGGSNVEGVMGTETLRAFDWIDYVVDGEAEQNFPVLVKNILAGNPYEAVPGISFRRGEEVVIHSDRPPMIDVNRVPIPDYSDYFEQLQTAGLSDQVSSAVAILFESARGCWWGEKAHCTFCGLNGQSMKYRSKSAKRVLREILFQSKKYQRLNLQAVDNILNQQFFPGLLPQLAEKNLGIEIFYEVKSNLTKEQVDAMNRSGIKYIQPGIESLHTEVLKLMRKGVTAIQNIQLLKWCAERKMNVAWNLLYGFPGERLDQYEQILNTIYMILHYQPPVDATRISIHRFSPYFVSPEQLGIKDIQPFPLYAYIYPDRVRLSEIAYHFNYSFKNGQVDPETYIRPVKDAVRTWEKTYSEKRIFYQFRKGPGFLELLDNRIFPSEEPGVRRTVLKGLKGSIYEFCEPYKSFKEIYQYAVSKSADVLSEGNVRSILNDFISRKQIFHENDRYLALALPA